MKNSRFVINATDIQRFTKKSERQCERDVNKIKEFVHKRGVQPLTVYDASKYYGVPVEDILKYLD